MRPTTQMGFLSFRVDKLFGFQVKAVIDLVGVVSLIELGPLKYREVSIRRNKYKHLDSQGRIDRCSVNRHYRGRN